MEIATALAGVAEIWYQTPEPARNAVVAGIGAVFGAWWSGRAAAKRKVIDELRAVSAAHALSVMIANKTIELKRQFIREIAAEYDALAEAHDVFMTDPNGPFELKMDLRTLSDITFPSQHLEKIIFEKLSLGYRGIGAAVSLSGATDDLRESIKYRNGLVSEFRDQSNAPVLVKSRKYLGLVDGDVVDDRFRSNVEALNLQTDCCIYFAWQLSVEIVTYENTLRARSWHFALPGTKLVDADWTQPATEGLLPEKAAFANWERGFRQRPSRLKRLFAALDPR